MNIHGLMAINAAGAILPRNLPYPPTYAKVNPADVPIVTLAISSDKRVPGIDVPTFVEQKVNLTLANWRGVVAPPGITPAQKQALVATVDKMHASQQWKDILKKEGWIDLYLSGPGFDTYIKEEDKRATEVLRSIGLVK